MSAEIITAIIIALGGASLIPKAIEAIGALRSGRAKEEKEENQSLLSRTLNAERRFDNESEFRRRIEEWAGGLVYMLTQIGVPLDKIPPKPERPVKVRNG